MDLPTEGKHCFFLSIVHSPGSLLDLMNWLQGGNGDSILSTLHTVSWVRWIGCEGENAGHKYIRSAACIPTGSLGTFEMHSLVQTWG